MKTLIVAFAALAVAGAAQAQTKPAAARPLDPATLQSAAAIVALEIGAE